MEKLINLIRDEEGANMAEYAILLGLIAVAVVTIVTALGTAINTTFSKALVALPS